MSQASKRTADLSLDEKRALLERMLRERSRQSQSFPLSFAQERLWFLDQLQPGNPFYNVPVALHLTGRLDTRALQRTLDEIINRHESLRTSFPIVDGLPVQIISAARELTLSVVNISELPAGARDTEVLRLVDEEALRCFDLAQGPLLRLSLLKLGEEEHVAVFTMHHIISDGWSMEILVRETAILYEAFLRGDSSPLPELPIQYADYAVWQRQWLQGDLLQEQLSYWKRQLKGAPPLLELPTDRPRPPIQSYSGSTEFMMLSERLSERLKRIGRQEGMTLFMTMMAAFKVLLYRMSGQEDICVGTPIAGRTRSELEPLIGFFVNTLVMKSKLRAGDSFLEVMRQEKKAVLEAFAHQDVPFERIVEEVSPGRSLSYSPIFQVMFALKNEPREALQLADTKLKPVGTGLRIAKFDLSLTVLDSQELYVSMEYNTDLFDAATIVRLLSNLHKLLRGICANPEQSISRLPLLTQAERRQLLNEWNDAKVEYPRSSCIHEIFEEQATNRPGAIAVEFRGQQISYQDLNRRANQLGRYLRRLGAGPETPVGICVERSIEMVVGLLAILKAGGGYVPFDPAYPKERLAFMIEDAQVSVLLTERKFVEILPEECVCLVCLDEDFPRISQESEENLSTSLLPESLAYIVYTSGSTGRPKGISIAHRGVVRLVINANYAQLDSEGVFLQNAPLSFDASTFEIWGSLLNGGRLVLFGGDAVSLKDLRMVIRNSGVNVLWLTSGLFHLIVEQRAEDLNGVKQLLMGGDVISPAAVVKALKEVKGLRLINGYGPTENTTFTCCYEAADSEAIAKSVPIGRPISNTKAYILDESQQLVCRGVVGELYAGGDGIARGYVGRADRTAERFLPDPFSAQPGARLYRTGDLARYLPGGEIDFIGRADYQVKIRGFRIELGEVEAAIAQYPDVKEVVVLAVDQKQLRASAHRRLEVSEDNQSSIAQTSPDDPPIDGKLLAAYVMPAQKSALEVSKLRGFLKNKLPDYMMPSAFVMVDSLPLTLNGKIDRRALLASGQAIFDREREFVIPRDILEFQLAHIWEEVIGVHPVGARDNFFELGGHSLLAARLMVRIQKAFGKELPLAALFEGATVEHLACILRQQAETIQWSPLVAIQPEGANQPFFCVHPGGGNILCYVELARHLGPDQPFYAFQSRGLNSEQPVCTKIEEMASLYIEAMRTVQPVGPYLLGGWSAGGVVAFEMARQLEAQGEIVALLVLIDSRAPDHHRELTEEDDVTAMASFGQHLGLPLERINISLDHFLSLDPDERLAYVMEEAKSADLIPADITLSQVHRLFEVFKANVTAMNTYAPEIARCRIALLAASERINDLPLEPAMGWGELTENGIEVIEVPGDHFTMMREPYVRFIAGRLKSCIYETMVSELNDD